MNETLKQLHDIRIIPVVAADDERMERPLSRIFLASGFLAMEIHFVSPPEKRFVFYSEVSDVLFGAEMS